MKDINNNELAKQLEHLLPLLQATADLSNANRLQLGLIYKDQYLEACKELQGAKAMRDTIFINGDYSRITPEFFEELLTDFSECEKALNECAARINAKAEVLFPEVKAAEEERGFYRFMKNLFGNLIK